MSIQSCYFCVQDVKNVLKKGINAVSWLPIFRLCSWCFQQPSGNPSTRARAPRA